MVKESERQVTRRRLGEGEVRSGEPGWHEQRRHVTTGGLELRLYGRICTALYGPTAV